jgi:hypothetical protein
MGEPGFAGSSLEYRWTVKSVPGRPTRLAMQTSTATSPPRRGTKLWRDSPVVTSFESGYPVLSHGAPATVSWSSTPCADAGAAGDARQPGRPHQHCGDPSRPTARRRAPPSAHVCPFARWARERPGRR